MLSLPGLESLTPAESTRTVTPGQLTESSKPAETTGFGAILARYSLTPVEAGKASATRADAGVPPDADPVTGIVPPVGTGQLLPLMRQADAPASDGVAALTDVSERLVDLTDTVRHLVSLEKNGDAPVSRYLEDELGLDPDQVDQVMQALQDWVDHPPELAITPDQLAELGPDIRDRLDALNQVLADLNQALSSWVADLDPDNGTRPPTDRIAGQTGADSGATSGNSLSARLAGGLEQLGAPSGAVSDGPSRPAQRIAQTLTTLMNTASHGSMPLSPDLGRPEIALLTTGDRQPSTDVAFNNTLVAMARDSLNDKGKADRESGLTLNAAIPTESVHGHASQSPTRPESAPRPDPALMARLERPVQAQDMGRQLGDRILMMARGDIKHASIRLDPPDLGLMDIKVTVHHDQTQVQIVVHNPQVRDALDSQSARLREVLEQQGLSLADLDVRDQSADQGDGGESGGGGQRAGAGDGGDWGSEEAIAEPVRQWRNGLVDDFV